MRIGIMGGTFDPIHNGHLLIGEYAREELSLEEVIYIPTGKPWHKDFTKVLSADERYKLVGLAIEGNPYFSKSSIEIKRAGTTYTIDTIKQLIEIRGDLDIYFIIGDDSLFQLESWKGFVDLIKLCSFVVFKRTKCRNEEIFREIKRLEELYKINLIFIDSPAIEISSTNIRKRISQGKSIKYMVPKNVESYIISQGIYEVR